MILGMRFPVTVCVRLLFVLMTPWAREIQLRYHTEDQATDTIESASEHACRAPDFVLSAWHCLGLRKLIDLNVKPLYGFVAYCHVIES